MYGVLDIFQADPFEVLRKMERDAGGAFESHGFIVFLPLGISLTGFHDNDLDEKAMAISVLEDWEASKERLKPISFSNKR